MRRLFRYIRGYEKETVIAPLFKMLEACFELLVPIVMATIIDEGIKNSDVPLIWRQCGLLVLLAVVGMVCSLTAQYFAAKSALGFGTALRRDLFAHIDTLSYTELDHIGTPTLVTRMTSDVNQVQNGLNMTLRLLLRCPFIVIGAIVMAFTISPRLTLWFLLITAVISLIIYLIMRATVPVYHKSQSALDRVTLLTRENYVGARVVRAFSHQEDEMADFAATNDRLRDFQLAAGRYCLPVLVCNVLCSGIQLVLGYGILFVLPLWNPDFVPRLQAIVTDPDLQRFLTWWNPELASVLLFLLCAAFAFLEAGIILYRMLRYAKK